MVNNSQLDAEDYDALATFRYAMRKFLSVSKHILSSSAQLTPEQYEALLALKAFSAETGLTIGELSERLQVRSHTAVALVSKLESRGLVGRVRGTEDRRQVFVRLNPSGHDLLAEVAIPHRRELRERSPELIKALSRLEK